MEKLSFFFLIISFFAICGETLPVPGTDQNIFDIMQTYNKEHCTVLHNSTFINASAQYMLNCKNIELNKDPGTLSFFNLRDFLCVGILDADVKLCNSVSSLKKLDILNIEDFKTGIQSIQNLSVGTFCDNLKNISNFNAKDISSKIADKVNITNRMKVLYDRFNQNYCVKICSDLNNKINELCSVMFLLNAHNRVIIKEINDGEPKLKVNHVQHSEGNSQPMMQVDDSSNKHNDPQKLKNENVPPVLIPADTKETQTNKMQSKPKGSTELSAEAKPKDGKNVNSQPPKQSAKEAAVVSNNKNKTSVKKESTTLSATINFEATPKPTVASAQNSNLGPDLTDRIPVESNTNPPLDADNKINVTTKDVNKKSNAVKVTESQTEKDKEPDVGGNVPEEKTPIPKQAEDDYNAGDDEDVPMKEQDNFHDLRPLGQSVSSRSFPEVEDSNFFSYFMFISVMFIAGYVIYHNKQKILALLLEGRRDRNSRRRPSTASYRKLNSNLEEAVTSKCSGSASHVIY